MKRITAFFISLTKITLEYPFLWMGLIYLLWFVKLPVPINENFEVGLRVLGIYVIIAVLEKLLGRNMLFSIILLIFILPIAFIMGWSFLNLIIETLGWLGSEVFYIPLILLFSGYAAFDLYQKPSNDNKTLRILLFIVTLPILSINVAYPISYFPDVTDQKDWGNDRYYLVWEIEGMDANSNFMLYKCQKSSIKCEELYRTYSEMWVDTILVDKEKKEVSVIDGNFNKGLAFTYGENPRRYDAFPVQLGDHIYQPTVGNDDEHCETTDCDFDVHNIYECNLDYTSCDRIPMQYSASWDVWIHLQVNETTNEINLYDDDDTLIYTYGEHPVCYVDDCVILDK